MPDRPRQSASHESWRAGSRPAAAPARRSRAGRRALALFALLGVVGLIVGLLALVTRDRAAEPVALSFVVAVPDHPVWPAQPFAEADGRRLMQALGGDAAANARIKGKLLDQLRSAALAADSARPLVLHVRALATVTPTGVAVLPADAAPADPTTWLPLADLLKAVGDHPARHKLLLLDLTPAQESPALGTTGDDLGTALDRELSTRDLGGTAVLTSAGPGERPGAMASVAASAFGFYVEEGLRVAAPAGKLSAHNLAAFVSGRVGRWSLACRGETQTPAFYGNGDFALFLPDATADDPAPVPTAYPDFLLKAWAERDAFAGDAARAYPVARRQWENDLLLIEDRWRAAPADAELPGRASKLTAAGVAARDSARPTKRATVAFAAARPAPPAGEAEWRTLKEKLAVTPNKADEAAAAEAALKAKASAAVVRTVLTDLINEPPPKFDRVKAAARALAATRTPEAFALARLADWEPYSHVWPAGPVALLACERAAGEALDAAQPAADRFAAALRTALADARAAEADLIVTDRTADTRAALPKLADATSRLQAVQRQARALIVGRAAHADALAALPADLPIFADQPTDWQQRWHEAAAEAVTLAPLLAAATLDAATVSTHATKLRDALDDLAKPFAADEIGRRVARLSANPPAPPREREALLALLASPRLTAADRKRLWDPARKRGGLLHDAVRERDDADLADGRPIATPPPSQRRPTSSATAAAFAAVKQLADADAERRVVLPHERQFELSPGESPAARRQRAHDAYQQIAAEHLRGLATLRSAIPDAKAALDALADRIAQEPLTPEPDPPPKPAPAPAAPPVP